MQFNLVTAAYDAGLYEIRHAGRLYHACVGAGALRTEPEFMEHVLAVPTFSHPLRVLVVEPDPEARRLYLDLLRPLGCDAIEAVNGREALVEALVRRPSVIVMESELPLANGPALCEILRRDSLTRTVPIVALAATTAQREVERIVRAGATSILTKPLAPDALVSELRRLVAAGEAVFEPATTAVPLTTGGKPRKRVAKSKLHVRYMAMSPPARPPTLRCTFCDDPLTYEHSYLGGVNHRQMEQSDNYTCPACGTFECRHRTRKLRELASNDRPTTHSPARWRRFEFCW